MAAFRKFKMGWREKARAFRFFDAVPLGHRMYYFAQKNITGALPRPLHPTSLTASRFLDHLAVAARHDKQPLSKLTIFEFGAGWDLYSNLVMWCYGVDSQIVYDRSFWARPDQINIVIQHLRKEPPEGASRLPTKLLDRTDFKESLKELYGIRYNAPADASHTDLPDGSVDMIVATSVLEHIPEAALRSLFLECRRILKPEGIMSQVIDYSDHYSHSDSKIGPYNFLQFTDEEWEAFSPGIHYQNRLRHIDFLRLFEESGFRVVETHSEQPDDAAELLRNLRLADRFRGHPVAELAPVVGHIVLSGTG